MDAWIGFLILLVVTIAVYIICEFNRIKCAYDEVIPVQPQKWQRRNDKKTGLPPGPISIAISHRSSQRKRREHERRMRG